MAKRLQLIAIAELVIILALVAGLAVEAQTIPRANPTTDSSSYSSSLESTASTANVTTIASAEVSTMSSASISYGSASGRCCVAIDTSENDNGTTFAYIVLNDSMPAIFAFDGVTFSIVSGSGSGSSCGMPGIGFLRAEYIYVAFADGESSRLSVCSLGFATPGLTVLLTSHVNPQAGLLLDTETNTVELLVAYSSPPLP
jgi:hypothetical protein